MTDKKEIKITIDGSFTQPACNFSVGFLRLKNDGKAETATPGGTGTFVKLGNVYGILTAGHVLEPIGANEVVGLVRFPGVQPPLQNFRLDLSHTERIVLWDGTGGHSPDIAFLKIPEIDGRRLEAAGAVFYNLGLAREFAPSKSEHRMSKCHAVVGVIGEWTEEGAATTGQGKKVEVGGLFGAAKDLREFKEGDTALIEVTVDHDAGPKIPNSYGGVSGGGLWELYVELDDKLKPVDVKTKLRGVAFRQSDDHKRITSNASSSIEALTKEIEKKWPTAK